MRKARISAARVFGAALAALLLVCGLLFVTGRAYAAMSGSGDGQQASASASETAVDASADADAEQLGLMPRLYRLTGQSTAAQGEGDLPTEGIGALFPNLLSIATTPTSISTGIECHMDEVCGFDPCTCGKPDAWGHCACGGFRDTVPTVTIASSDPNVVQVVQAFGQTWIMPVAPGTATVQITAGLRPLPKRQLRLQRRSRALWGVGRASDCGGDPAGRRHSDGAVLPCAPCRARDALAAGRTASVA